MKHIITAAAAGLLFAQGAWANTVLLDADFNTGHDWQSQLPLYIEGDHNNPAANVFPLFTDDKGTARPWWKLKDAATSDDGFLCSHSIYTTPGTSNDWIQSGAMYIDSEGYTLTFGAQSCPFRSGDPRLSDLHVFITGSPLDENALPDPSAAALFIPQVPVGDKTYDVEKDFIPYSLSLDPWVGQTVYVAFANLNTDRDLLCLDDIKVERLDPVEITVTDNAEEFGGRKYTDAGAIDVNVSVWAAGGVAVGPWTLTLTADGVETESVSGQSIAAGDFAEHTFKVTAATDRAVEWSVAFSTPGAHDVVRSGSVTGLSFRPEHRVLVEEATGMWCGNCPMGMYNMEMLSEHPDTRDWAIPVSVHIAGSGNDYLVDLTYSGMLGITSAPAYRVERDLVVRYFSQDLDCAEFDPSRAGSMAEFMTARHNALTLFDIAMDADWVTAGADTTAVACRVSVTPAAGLDTERYRIGLAMKENNVHGGMSSLMMQHNYLAGQTANLPSSVGGWTEMPEYILDMRYHDVARAVYKFNGYAESMPASMACGETHVFEQTVDIPDTYQEISGKLANPAVKTDFVTMVAYIVDMETQAVVNAVAVPMSDKAPHRYDNTGYFTNAVESVESDPSAPAEWYTLQGVRVERPSSGLYIERRGTTVRKVLL